MEEAKTVVATLQEIRSKLEKLDARLKSMENSQQLGNGKRKTPGDINRKGKMAQLEGLREGDNFFTFVESFVSLVNQVELTEEDRVTMFVNGLKDDKKVIRVLKPNTLQRAIDFAKVLTPEEGTYTNKEGVTGHKVSLAHLVPDKIDGLEQQIQEADEVNDLSLKQHECFEMVGLAQSMSTPHYGPFKTGQTGLDSSKKVSKEDKMETGLEILKKDNHQQIAEIKEDSEPSFEQFECLKSLESAQPRYVRIYGLTDNRKILLAKVVINQAKETINRGSNFEVVQRFKEERSRVLRELFVRARKLVPSIIFTEEMDRIGSVLRESGGSKRNNEKQGTMPQLPSHPGGFETDGKLQISTTMNCSDARNQVLLRTRWNDRKHECPDSNDKFRLKVLKICFGKMNFGKVKLEGGIIWTMQDQGYEALYGYSPTRHTHGHGTILNSEGKLVLGNMNIMWQLQLYKQVLVREAEDLERPLVSEDAEGCTGQTHASARSCDLEGPLFPKDGYLRPPLIHNLMLPFSSSHFNQGVSRVVGVSNPTENVHVGQTLKRSLSSCLSFEKQNIFKKEHLNTNSEVGLNLEQPEDVVIKDNSDQRSCLTLEVFSGPSQMTRCSVQSTDTPRFPLTVGRVFPSDLLVKDSEFSRKHAMITWNLNKLKWELVEMGSLDGTLLNSQPNNHLDSGSRHWSDPIELSSEEVITLGTTSSVSDQITSLSKCFVSFGVGISSDPMALRCGGKKLTIGVVCYYQWPLLGHDQFGLFGICYGHNGAEAAKYAGKGSPKTLDIVLSASFNKEKLVSQKDASHVLYETIFRTEECMTHYYEGCTAIVLLIWHNGKGELFAQCANVGDSACVVNVDAKLVKMTEDHIVTSSSERLRIRETGKPLKVRDPRSVTWKLLFDLLTLGPNCTLEDKGAVEGEVLMQVNGKEVGNAHLMRKMLQLQPRNEVLQATEGDMLNTTG